MRLAKGLAAAAQLLVMAMCTARTGRADDGPFAPVAYDLREGSILIDDCANCERPSRVEELQGTFTLTRLAVRVPGEVYEVSELELTSLSYKVTGSGKLSRGGNLESQWLDLDLEANGTPGVKLTGTAEAPLEAWPTFEIEVAEDGERDPFHVYRIRMVAAPVTNMVLYRLVEGEGGSYLAEDCAFCLAPPMPRLVDIGGTFLLGKIEEVLGAPAKFRVDGIDFHGLNEDQDYRIKGLGIYFQGGSPPPSQDMDLTIQVNNGRVIHLESDPWAAVEGSPLIDILLRENDPPIHAVNRYSLQIVARPVGAVEFRRGDVNADGRIRLGDAIMTLVRVFARDVQLPCDKSADGDDNGKLELADAVYLLTYIFTGGAQAPKEPFPDCGRDPTADTLTCESYPPCS